ncbi:MAG TPA: hypothetical protein VGK54_03705, partial [Chloroflexota bacterium]
EDYRLLRSIVVLDFESEAVLLRARRTNRQVKVTCSAEDFDEILGFVAFEAHCEVQRRRRTRLDALYERLQHGG